VLIIADFRVMAPALRNDVERVGTDQIHANKSGLLNPTIS
jgi:hypothetical protein